MATCLAACSRTDPGVDILFSADDTRLDESDKRALAALVATYFPLSADGRHFEDRNCGDVMPVAEVVDLDGNHDFEVFLSWGNACTSGGAGRSLTLFTRRPVGGYEAQLGFPAFGWAALDSGNGGWPDLSFGGPGFCHPVWTWHANAYSFKCNLAESEGGCDGRGNIC